MTPPASRGLARLAMTRSTAVTSIVSVGFVGLAGVLIVVSAARFQWATTRLVVAAVALFVVGLAVASEHLVASSAAPAMVAVVVAGIGRDEVAWAISLVVGCSWFVALELAGAAIGRRAGIEIGSAVARQRATEVATVVTLAVAIGAVALLIVSWTPDRSIALQALVAASVLVGLTTLLRRVRPG